jgi:hypothetical protein
MPAKKPATKKTAPKRAATSKAKKTTTRRKSTPRRSQQLYYRNLRAVPVSFRFTNADKDRRVALAPRGQRGDLAPVKKDEKDEPEYINNQGLIFEIITAEEAKIIADKQVTNAQKGVHPALQQIRNQHGEHYESPEVVRVNPEKGKQGRKVAPLNEEGQIEFENKGILQQGSQISGGLSIRRSSEFPGGEGYQSDIQVPEDISPEEQAEWVRNRRQELLDAAELDAEQHRKAITERPDADYLDELRGKTRTG